MKKVLLIGLILILSFSGCTEFILDSSDGSLLITGNETTNTVDIVVAGNISGGGNGTDIYFGVINPDAGTSPIADGPNQTLNLTSTDIIVTGNAGTKTISFAYGLDSVDDVHINWGNVSGSDMPVGLPGDTEYIDEMFEDTTPNGMLDIITVTDQGGRGISWSTGEIFVNGNIIETNAAGNTTCDDNALSYLYGTVAGGANLILSVVEPAGEYALVARIYTYAGDIEYILVESIISEAVEDIHGSLDDLHSELVNSGLLAAIDTDGTRADDFTIASGSYYLHAHDKITINTTLYSSGVARNVQNTRTYFHTGGVWGTGTSYGVDFANWDDGNNKVGTTPGKWYTAWIFLEGNGTIEYVYPQTEHATEAAALDEGLTYPPLHQGYVVPIAKFIFKHGEVAFVPNKSYLVDIRPLHGSSSGSIGAVLQNIWYTITSDAGSTTADDPLDVLNIVGGVGIGTAIAGDTLTITNTGGAGVADHDLLNNLNWAAADHTIDANVNFNQYKAIALICDNGSSLPAAPILGQWFLHTPTGRNILMMHNGSAWNSIISLGNMTVYVDATDGNDTVGNGGTVDSGAFQTVQYAIDIVPPLFSGTVTINLNGETYAEAVTILGKSPTGDFKLILQGNLTVDSSGTGSGNGLQGGAAVQGYVNDAGDFGATDELLIYLDADEDWRIVDSDTANRATIVGIFTSQPLIGESWVVYDWATEIEFLTIGAGQKSVECYDIYFTHTDVDVFVCWISQFAEVAFYRCKFESTAITTNAMVITEGGSFFIDTCFMTASQAFAGCVGARKLGSFTVERSKLIATHTNGRIVFADSNSIGFIVQGTVIDGTAGGAEAQYGILCTGNAYVNTFNVATDSYVRIRDCDTGVRAQFGGFVIGTVPVQFSGNGVNKSEHGASFGYID